MPDFQMLAELVAVAAALSGYPPIPAAALPPIQILAPAEFNNAVCPDNPDECSGIAAHFDEDGPRIRLVARLNLAHPLGRSFLVHELVHVLQYHQRRGNITVAAAPGCLESLRAEQEAYAVQNEYLSWAGQSMRFGGAIMAMRCREQQTSGTHFQLMPVKRGR